MQIGIGNIAKKLGAGSEDDDYFVRNIFNIQVT